MPQTIHPDLTLARVPTIMVKLVNRNTRVTINPHRQG